MKKVKVPAERIKLSENSSEIDHHKNQARHLARYLEPVLTEWNKLNIGEITLAEIESALHNPSIKVVEQLVRTKVAGEANVEVQGLKLSIEKVREMVEIPNITNLSKEWMQLYGAAKRCREAQRPVYLSSLIVVDGEVCICQDTLDQVIDNNSDFAETEAEKEVYLILEEMAEAARYLKDKYNLPVFLGEFIEQTRDLPNHPGETKLVTGAIKRHFSIFGR